MLDQIHSLYEKLNEQYLANFFYPDSLLRDQIKYDLERKLGESITVKCDLENNSLEISRAGCIRAQIKWKEYPAAIEVKSVDLIFGNPWDIEIIKKSL